jgi:hypothetical protein
VKPKNPNASPWVRSTTRLFASFRRRSSSQAPPAAGGPPPSAASPPARPPPSRRRPLSRGTGYTASPAPPISRRDEEGFSSCLTCPAHRAVAHTPPEGTRRLSQPATLPAAFAREISARPPESFVEAILAFTHVTARSLAPILPMVSSMGFRALVSRRPAIQATGRLAVAPVDAKCASREGRRVSHWISSPISRRTARDFSAAF